MIDMLYMMEDWIKYTLWVNGKKKIFLPLIESPDEVSCTAIKFCMVDEKKFEKEVKKNQVCFAIVPRGPSVGSNDQATKAGNDQVTTEASNDRVIVEIGRSWVLAKIEIVLNEYKDIVVEDILHGLPPIRSISHCMDLIPRASLPNKASYRLTPTENEELNRPVQEFLQKGLINESLSPCVVPTILAPKKNG